MSDGTPPSSRPRLRLPGRHVVVTGAGGGIGSALAHAAADEGATVACVDIDLEAAQVCVDDLRTRGAQAHAVFCDITDPASCAEAVEACVEAAGPVDVLFANAGGAKGGGAPFLEITPENFVSVVERNLHGAFFSGQAFARHMATQGRGSIVYTASQIGLVAYPDMAHYCSAKGGVIELVRCMAAELAPHGIRVNAIAPGPVLTPRLKAALAGSASLSALHSKIPLDRLADPGEITGAAIYLASDDATYTTGTTLVVDGGYTAW